jgi:hypothetical protein
MNARRSPLIRILVSIVFVSGLTSQAIAGYFPPRPPDIPLQFFTGVLSDYGLGNGTGGFALTIGAKTMDFYIGLPMTMNGTIVLCTDANPTLRESGVCDDWPSAIIVGKSVVTATCWSDTTFNPGKSTLFCDEIDSRTYWIKHHRKLKTQRMHP